MRLLKSDVTVCFMFFLLLFTNRIRSDNSCDDKNCDGDDAVKRDCGCPKNREKRVESDSDEEKVELPRVSDITGSDIEKEEDLYSGEDFKQTAYKETTFDHSDEGWKTLVEEYTPNELIHLEGGSFIMGTDDSPIPQDGEGPSRTVILKPFSIDKYEVSNGEFREYVLATNYITEAEKFGDSFVMDYFVSKEVSDTINKAVKDAQWWIPVPKASWKLPEGKGSSLKNRLNHPVVHVSWNDASAFCQWKGKRLPTEAEWEFACRGGKQNRLFPWGNKYQPRGEHRCNIWQGNFPSNNTAEDGCAGTCAVDSFLQNKYGLYNMVGNVWEWVLDWWTTKHSHRPENNPRGPPSGEDKVKKGGSFMCSKKFCYRYRCSARGKNSADSSASNLGFRCVKPHSPSVMKEKKEKTEL